MVESSLKTNKFLSLLWLEEARSWSFQLCAVSVSSRLKKREINFLVMQHFSIQKHFQFIMILMIRKMLMMTQLIVRQKIFFLFHRFHRALIQTNDLYSNTLIIFLHDRSIKLIKNIPKCTHYSNIKQFTYVYKSLCVIFSTLKLRLCRTKSPKTKIFSIRTLKLSCLVYAINSCYST